MLTISQSHLCQVSSKGEANVRVLAGVISFIALAIVAGSAATVLTKEDEPRLAVNIAGVPAYVYYERSYELTIEYANQGGAISGPVELSAELPPTFALAEHIDDPARHGERLVWQLDGLDAGEEGSIAISVQGTLPADLTEAVYDLPGYEGHTAFVEGFQFAVSLTAGDASAEALAVADTGAAVGAGEITIIKSAGPGADADFDFSISAPGAEPCEDASFTLNDGSPATDSVTFVGCALGVDYLVTETSLAPGWVFDSISCGENGDVDFLESGSSVTITLNEPDAQATCAFTNVEEEETGSITFIKDTNPETNDIFFDFDGDFGDFDLEDDDSITFDDLDEDTYTVTENEATGWNLVEIDCGDADYSVSLNTETVEIDLNEGEDVTCTFVNEEDDDGTIIIEKDVDPEPDGTNFSFSDNIPGCVIGVLDDDSDGGTPNSATCTNLPAGEYVVTEDNPSPYALVSIVCDDAGTSVSVASRTAFIDLDPGETVHCVFKNQPSAQASITIFKDTNPETINVLFDFDSPQFGDFDLFDNGARIFSNLNSGAYSVTENPPSGWALLDIDCDSTDVIFNGHTVVIDVDPGEHVTCVFVNVPTTTPAAPTPTKTPVPSPTVGPIIAAPSAGDGGLADSGLPWVFGVISVLAASTTTWIFIQRQVRRSRDG